MESLKTIEAAQEEHKGEATVYELTVEMILLLQLRASFGFYFL